MKSDFIKKFGIRQDVFTFNGKLSKRTDYYLDDKLKEIWKWVNDNCADKNKIYEIICYWETVIAADNGKSDFRNMKDMIQKTRDTFD